MEWKMVLHEEEMDEPRAVRDVIPCVGTHVRRLAHMNIEHCVGNERLWGRIDAMPRQCYKSPNTGWISGCVSGGVTGISK